MMIPILGTITDILKTEGYQVTVVAKGKTGLKKARDKTFGVARNMQLLHPTRFMLITPKVLVSMISGRTRFLHLRFVQVDVITTQILPIIDYNPQGDAEAQEGTPSHQRTTLSATRNLLKLLSYTSDIQINAQDTVNLLTPSTMVLE